MTEVEHKSILELTKTPHISPSQASYRVFIVQIWEKTAWQRHCTVCCTVLRKYQSVSRRYKVTYTLVTIGPGNDLLPISNKPSGEQMLPCHSGDHREHKHTGRNLHLNIPNVIRFSCNFLLTWIFLAVSKLSNGETCFTFCVWESHTWLGIVPTANQNSIAIKSLPYLHIFHSHATWFSWMKIVVSWYNFHWNLFLRVWVTRRSY